ncbi:MAG: ABC transporter substrate-binding protein [Ilumatobacteraceae bacterium]|nr:ABC transporter substrate-binding protein [Ilumatobacteraceae bacterium]
MYAERKWGPFEPRGMAAAAIALATIAFTSQVAAQAPKVLSWGKSADLDGMDVHEAGTVASWQLYQMVYETLLTTDKDLNLRPGLAESWKQTSPTVYVLTLRKEARWSNGRPVVAADVIGSLQRITGAEMNPAGVAAAKTDDEKKTASRKIDSYWARQLGVIKSLVATDAHTVRVELEKPHTAFLAALAHVTAAIIPIKELTDTSFDPTRQLLGSGPFMVADYKPKESWTLVRNPHYWRKGYPKADRLNVVIIPDEAARVAALRDGRIDYATFSNPDIGRLVAGDKRLVVDAQNTTNYFRMDINALSDKSAFKDKRVRQAANLAIDREAIAGIVFAGAAKPDMPVPGAFGKSACKDTDTYKLPRAARLDKARQLMAATGKKSVDVEIVASSADPVYARIAQLIQQNLKPVGINVKLLQLPVAEAINKVFTKSDFDASISWLAGYSDPSMVVAWWNPKFAVWNVGFHEYVPTLADALEKLKSAPEGSERDAQLADVCRQIDDGANILALVSKVDFVVHRADTMDIRLDPVSGSSSTFQYVAEFVSKKTASEK